MGDEILKDHKETSPNSPDSRFATQLELFQKTINNAQKSNFPEIKKFALESQKRLDTLSQSKDKNQAIILVISEIDKIQAIMAFFAYQKCVDEIKSSLKKTTENLQNSHNSEIKEIFKKYPEMSPQYRTKLQNASTIRTKKLTAAYNTEFLPDHLTQQQFIKDSDQGYQALAQAQELRTAVLDGEQPSVTSEINQEFETQCDAIIFTQLADDSKESETYLTNQTNQLTTSLKNQKSQLEIELEADPENQELKFELEEITFSIKEAEDLQVNTLTLLKGFPHQDQSKKRAVIIAYFQDHLDAISTQSEEVDTKKFEATLQLTGQKKDSIANKLADAEINDDPFFEKKINKIANLKLADFRMEVTGFLLAKNTGPERLCRIVDQQTYQFTNENGATVKYIHVQLDPPNGARGYVPSDSLDFKKIPQSPLSSEKTSKTSPKLIDILKQKKLSADFFKEDEPTPTPEEINYPREVARKLSVFGGHETVNTVTDWLTKTHPDALEHLKKRIGSENEPSLEQLLEVGTTLYIEKNPSLLHDLQIKKINTNTAFETALDEIIPDWDSYQ